MPKFPTHKGVNSKRKQKRKWKKKRNDNDFDELSSILSVSKKNNKQKDSIKDSNNSNPNSKNPKPTHNTTKLKRPNNTNTNTNTSTTKNSPKNQTSESLLLQKIESIKKLQASMKTSPNSKKTEMQSRVPTYVNKTKEEAISKRNLSRKQLARMPNEFLIPKCSLCGMTMVLARGDSAYEEYESSTCDYCGRENIKGEMWHCSKGIIKSRNSTNEHLNTIHNGFDLCKTCAYLIPRGRKHEIRRPGPPEDDLGLILSGKQRNRRKTNDGHAIYKFKEIQDVLKIGIGGGTSMCPFDCDCCF